MSTTTSSESTTGIFESLRIRNFRLFFVGQLISQIGNWLTIITLTLLVLHLTDDGVALGILAACQFGPVLALGPWAGLVADRSQKRNLLVKIQGFGMLQSGALAVLAFMDQPSLLAIYAIALLGGIGTALDNPVRRSFITDMVPDENVHNAVSLNSALMTSARVVGPALGGVLISLVGFGWTFVIDACSYVAVIGGLLLMKAGELRHSTVVSQARRQVRAGFRYALTVTELWVPIVMVAIVGVFALNYQTVLPLYVKRSLGADDTAFTLLFSALSCGSLIGSVAAARRRVINLYTLTVAAAALGMSLSALAVTPNILGAYAVAVAVGASSTTFLTTSTVLLQLGSSPEMRGRMLALQATMSVGSTPIGGPLLGSICDVFGARSGVFVGGAAAFAAAAFGLKMARSS